MDLIRDGVAVVRVVTPAQAAAHREAIRQMRPMEFVVHDGPLVMGGFGAHGHPSSFHDPVIRQFRSEVVPVMESFFRQHFRGAFIEALFDRVCVRPRGSKTTKEAWHRDISPPNTGQVFGGWVNLDDTDQFFSCCPGSHRDATTGASGFVRSGPSETETRIPVPPGHAIVFYQQILHQVLPGRQKQDSYRVFQGFKISADDQPLFPRELTDQWIDDQAVPLLPSGQKPPVFSSNHSSVFLFSGTQNDPIAFSARVHPSCVREKVCHGAKNRGKPYRIVDRHMTSLRAYNLPMLPPYTEEERRIFHPHPL